MTTPAQRPAATRPLERPECRTLRQRIEKAVLRGDAVAVVSCLMASRELPGLEREGSLSLQVLSQGFGGGMTSFDRTSFAGFCMNKKQVAVLEAVLRCNLAPRQSLVDAVTSWSEQTESKRNGRPAALARGIADHSRPLIEHAVISMSAAGLRLAMEFEPHSTRLTEVMRKNPASPARTWHGDALEFAMVSLRNSGFEQSVEVCRAFVEAGMPALSAESTNFVLDRLVSIGGPSVRRPSMRNLFEFYRAGGQIVGLDERLTMSGRLPLTTAIQNDNREMAVQLIEMGADIDLVGADAGMPGADLLAVIAAQDHARVGEFVAEVAQLLMQRQMSRRAAAPGASQAVDAAQAAPARRRAPSV